MSITNEVSIIASAALPICEQWAIRRCRLQSDSAGPRLCITSGIHGNELIGQRIIFMISHCIQTHPEYFSGTLDLYPMLNPLGLDLNERMVPSHTWLDMNRAFPGQKDGTPLETMCFQILNDLSGADLVLDIHASTTEKNELYEVRMNHARHDDLIPQAASLCPDIIWVYPDRPSFDSSLTGALSRLGTDAFILEADERSMNPDGISKRIFTGILTKMHEMGMWSDSGITLTVVEDIPVIYSGKNIERITCENPGIFIPESRIGSVINMGDSLGYIISALEGIILENVLSPCNGLVFTQRSYSAVYPGTLLARIRKEAV